MIDWRIKKVREIVIVNETLKAYNYTHDLLICNHRFFLKNSTKYFSYFL